MGWTTTDKPKGESASDFIKRRVLSWGDDCPATYTVLDTAIVKLRTFYAAVERIDKATGVREVWAAIFLLSYGPTKYDSNNFGWKDMDETMGPCESECPERILDLLTPTESQYANDWRDRCRAYHAKRKSAPKVAPGWKVTLFGKQYTIESSLGRKGWMARDMNRQPWRLSCAQILRCTDFIEPEPSAQVRNVRPVAVVQQINLF